MTKSESKFNNTADKMNDALLRILERKEFSDITVSEVCEEARVNRSTFYSHYENTSDLLKETQKNLIKHFLDGFDTTVNIYNIKDIGAEELIFVSPEYIIPYLQFIKANKGVFKVYMNNLSNFSVGDMDKLLIENVIAPVFAKNGVTDSVVINYMSRYYLNGITAITMEWVNRDCAESEEFVCEVITSCVRP